jgi:hypothetical protein
MPEAVTDLEGERLGLLRQVGVPQVRLCQPAEAPVRSDIVPIQLHPPTRREVEVIRDP